MVTEYRLSVLVASSRVHYEDGNDWRIMLSTFKMWAERWETQRLVKLEQHIVYGLSAKMVYQLEDDIDIAEAPAIWKRGTILTISLVDKRTIWETAASEYNNDGHEGTERGIGFDQEGN